MPEEVSPKIIYSWNPDRRNTFTLAIKDKIEARQIGKKDINFGIIIDLIKETASEMDMMRISKRKKNVQTQDRPWYSKICREKKKQVRKAYRHFKKQDSEDSRKEYVCKKREFREMVRCEKRKSIEELKRCINNVKKKSTVLGGRKEV